MKLQSMITAVQQDTQLGDTAFIISKLNFAQAWISNRITAMNSEILKVTDDEITLATDTHSYDLAANVSTGTLYQIEWLGVKYASDQTFVPVVFTKGSRPEFIFWDQQGVQSVHPQYVVIDDFNQVRFAPGIPSGSQIRVDYLYRPRDMSLDEQTTCDLPEIFHPAMVSEAIARCFHGIDDVRALEYHTRAMDEEYGAKNVLTVRQFQQAPRTRPSNRGNRRLIY